MSQSSSDSFSSALNSADGVLQSLREGDTRQMGGEAVFMDESFASWWGDLDIYNCTPIDHQDPIITRLGNESEEFRQEQIQIIS